MNENQMSAHRPSEKEKNQLLKWYAEGCIDIINKGNGEVEIKALVTTDAELEDAIRTSWNTGMNRGDLFIPNAVIRDRRLIGGEIDWFCFAYARKLNNASFAEVAKVVKAEMGYSKGQIKKSLIRLCKLRMITSIDDL